MVDRDIILLRMYRIFNVKDETHITTQKLAYIYDWVEPRAGEVSLDVITALRKAFKRESNLRTIDAFYTEVKLINMTDSGRYDFSTKKSPRLSERYYVGWRLG
jgi:hypothetical protein